ncbi:TonB-dependent receptor [Flavobacterium sp. UMI-01]|uniref:SusC/RagA family TonB-linked outer membrane protein n=1 Tax=Flavobacterium sp. UMI-01 TaxID=1441053 RepID=UPI0005A318CC|nr:TonB-dependent receptor [Flavobacterium sp. UMI-01]BAQ25540.1 SusC-like protein [Flavobacterium sp. UMI-01]GIZ07775.1 SusC/RagA family TonB-linked outer membrane protein [Flavobacterium sp. UMI-01]
MNLKTKLSIMLILIFNITLFAQEGYVLSGTVSDGSKMPIPGANIIVANSTNGTATDFDGNFKLNVKSGDVLQFSYIGYITQSIKITNQKKLNVVLVESEKQLEEVVIVGYGARKKSDITGAVSSVKADEINAFPLADATQALQGRAAGVVVQSNNGGEPGAPISIKVRGNTSINAASDPLIVVDGFVGATMPQASDIQSIEVLKDASATAIYGSRGSNGVVMVTTKKGRVGKLTVEMNTNYSLQNTSNRLDLLNAEEFIAYKKITNPSFVAGTADTDWQDLLYRTGSTQNHQFSFSGGSDKINFYASANYFKQEGIVINSDFERLTFLSNIDAQVTDKLKLGFNLFSSRGTKNGVPTQSTGLTANGGGDDVISLMFRFRPDFGVKDPVTGLNTTDATGDEVDNPYAIATEAVNNTKTDINRSNLYANYDIIKNLTFKTTFGFSTTNETFGTFRPSTLLVTAGRGTGGKASISNLKKTDVLSESYLTYNKEIGKGTLNLLAGYSYQKTTSERFSAGAQKFVDDSFSYYNLAGSAVTVLPTSSFTEQEIESQFGRLNYDYNDKYLLTATLRRDGASNFAKNHKYAIFPSGALGWKISNEDFLKDSETISNLKVRASYGVTGNQAISPYQSLASLTTVYTGINNQVVGTVVPNQAANDNLKWESSYQTNFGIDLGLLNNKISLSLDYYNIDTKDLLLADQSQSEYLGFVTLASIRNIGEINNKGFEISLNTRNITNENFRWTTDFNWSTNKNEVKKLIGGIDVIQNAAPGYFSNQSGTHILREGEAAGVFYGLEYMGVYQGGTLPTGTATTAAAATRQAGDPLFLDVDGSGVITTGDRKLIGDPNPDWNMGITNNFTYKNFDLNIFFQGSYGGDVFNLTKAQLYRGNSNALKEVLNAWTPTNTNTDIPRVVADRREISSRFVEDGSYIRLKNIALGYNFPSTVIDRLGVESLRFTISAQNLLTFTKYSGLDPEVSYFGSGGGNTGTANTTKGFDFGNFPTVRSVNFSLSLKF